MSFLSNLSFSLIEDVHSLFYWGLWIGFILGLMVYNLILFVLQRDRTLYRAFGRQETNWFCTVAFVILVGSIVAQFFTPYGIVVGVAVEACIISLVLTARFKRSEMDHLSDKQSKEITLRKYEEITQAVTMMAHDIRKPYSLLEILLQILSKATSLNQIQQFAHKYSDSIRQAVKLVNTMLDDIVHFGREEKNTTRSSCDVSILVDACLKTVFAADKEANMEFKYTFAATMCCYANEQNLLRSMVNIVSNAVQATGGKGKLWFSTLLSSDKNWLSIQIGNEGSFIAAEDLDRVFDLFYTKGKKGGRGLGLAIARKFIEADGGRILCRSNGIDEVVFDIILPVCRDGKTFTPPLLPASTKEVSAGTELDTQKIENLQRITILMLEDDDIYVDYFEKMITDAPLLRNKVRLVRAMNGSKALEIAAAERPELIVVDYDLNGKETGFDVITALRDQTTYHPLICLHSNRLFADVERLKRDYRIDAFLNKPIALADLLSLLITASGMKVWTMQV